MVRNLNRQATRKKSLVRRSGDAGEDNSQRDQALIHGRRGCSDGRFPVRLLMVRTLSSTCHPGRFIGEQLIRDPHPGC